MMILTAITFIYIVSSLFGLVNSNLQLDTHNSESQGSPTEPKSVKQINVIANYINCLTSMFYFGIVVATVLVGSTIKKESQKMAIVVHKAIDYLSNPKVIRCVRLK